jgi:uncharacterized protein YkwD
MIASARFRIINWWGIMKTVAVFIVSLFMFSVPASAIDTDKHINEPSHYSKELLDLVNHYLLSDRLKSLSFDKKLIALTQGHGSNMHRSGDLNHDGFSERFKRSGCTNCIENVGWNCKTAKEQFLAWKRSKGHDSNMLAGDIQRVGISKIGPI